MVNPVISQRVVQLLGRGLRGESFGDTARRLGNVSGLAIPSNATDEQIINALTASIAITGANTYPDTAAGIGATTSGQTFWVADLNGLSLYRNQSGTAVEINPFVSSDQVGYSGGTVTDALDDALQYINHGGRKFRIVECVLRNTGDGWGVIDDATHKNTGVASVEVDGFAIKVNYDFVAKNVLSAVSAADEVFARSGIITGASVGIYSSLIDVCAPFTGFIDDTGASPTITTASFWNATVAKSGALLTVSYPPLGGDATIQLTPYESRLSGVASPGRDLVPTSVGSSSFAIGQKIPFAAAVNYNGSAWVFSSALLASIQGLLSAAWVGNELVVTHPPLGGGNPVQATSMNSAYRAVITSISSTETKIQFVDSSGVIASAPNANMRVSLSFPSTARAASFLQGSRFAFNRGICRITPDNLVSPNGNIWFRAILEVD